MNNQPQQIIDAITQRLINHLSLQDVADNKLNQAREKIRTRFENKTIEIFLSLMNPEQLEQYKKALDTHDPVTIESISAEIALTMPKLETTLNQVMEAEYQQILSELSA